ncbi:hypothetical protein DdX_09196 [Ditylenchus destructor]|uniref:Uncharacterized protein n=1 Tax=Ditylenchus destructor TaxID=166010 RepID=A0AAD4N1A7_9BILA|nr:hypothetical protein DdX_09196 [Ditylenchus destructor]
MFPDKTNIEIAGRESNAILKLIKSTQVGYFSVHFQFVIGLSTQLSVIYFESKATWLWSANTACSSSSHVAGDNLMDLSSGQNDIFKVAGSKIWNWIWKKFVYSIIAWKSTDYNLAVKIQVNETFKEECPSKKQ